MFEVREFLSVAHKANAVIQYTKKDVFHVSGPYLSVKTYVVLCVLYI